jgi:hypothetical protein
MMESQKGVFNQTISSMKKRQAQPGFVQGHTKREVEWRIFSNAKTTLTRRERIAPG